jgi:hypothetical protein
VALIFWGLLQEQYTQEAAVIVGERGKWLEAISNDVAEKMAEPEEEDVIDAEHKRITNLLTNVLASIKKIKDDWPNLQKQRSASLTEDNQPEENLLPEGLTAAINQLDGILQQLIAEKSKLKKRRDEANKKFKKLDKQVHQAENALRRGVSDAEKRKEDIKSKNDLDDERTQTYKAIETIKTTLSSLKKIIAQLLSQKEDAICLREKRRERAVLIICEDQKSANTVLLEMKKKFDDKTVLSYTSYYKQLNLEQVLPGTIIVATNIAGRGTNLKISNVLNDGLHVILSYLPQTIRTEMQALRRTARQGKKGSGRIIVCDERANDSILSIELLRDERDAAESKRLKDFLETTIKRLKLEQDLFSRFVALQGDAKQIFQAKKSDPQFAQLQIKSLQNHWAYWLEAQNKKIGDIAEPEVFAAFEVFATKMRNDQQNGEHGFICEPAELIKLGHYYIGIKQWKKAQVCYDRVIELEPDFSGFAYYYKAQSILGLGHSFEEKKEARKNLGFAMELLQAEIDRIMTCNKVIGLVSGYQTDKGQGLDVDYFTESNTHEIGVLTVHINAIKSILGSELTLENFRSGPVVDEENARIVFDNLRKLLPSKIKDYRINKGVKIEEDPDTKEEALYYMNNNKKERVNFPMPFIYCKDQIFERIKERIRPDDERNRQINLKKWCSFIFSEETILSSSFVTEETNIVFAKQLEQRVRGSVLWDHDVFGGKGKAIKEHILQYDGDSNLTEDAFIDYLKEFSETAGDLDWPGIKETLRKQKIIHRKRKHTLTTETSETVDRCMSKLCFNRDNKKDRIEEIENLPLAQYPEFSEHKDQLIKQLKSTWDENDKELTEEDLGLDTDAFKKLYLLLYSEGFLRVGLSDALNFDKKLPAYHHATFESCLIALSEQKQINLSRLTLPRNARAGAMTLWNFMNARHIGLNPIVNFPLSPEYNRRAEMYFDRITKEIKDKLASVLEGRRYYHVTFSPLTKKEKENIQQGTSIVFEYNENGWFIHFTNEENKLSEKPINKAGHLDLLNELKDDALSERKNQDNRNFRYLNEEESEKNKLARLSKIILDRHHVHFKEFNKLSASLAGPNFLKGIPAFKDDEDKNAYEEAIGKALESAIGTLKMLPKLKLNPEKINKYFQAGKVPPEILDYTRRCCADVLTLVEDVGWWNWDVFFCAVIGVAQIVAGILVTSIGMPILGKMLISEGIGDICFAVQASIDGNFSWKVYGRYKVESLLVTIACAGVAAGFSQNITKVGGFVKKTESFSKMILGGVCMDLVEAGASIALNSAASTLSEKLLSSTFREIRKSQRKHFREKGRVEKIQGEISERVLMLYNAIGSDKATRKINHIVDMLNVKDTSDLFDSLFYIVQTLSSGLSKFSGIATGGKFGKLLSLLNPISKFFGLIGAEKAKLDVSLKTEKLFDKLCRKLDDAIQDADEKCQSDNEETIYSSKKIHQETSKIFDKILSQVEILFQRALTKTSVSSINFARNILDEEDILKDPMKKMRKVIAPGMQTLYDREKQYRTDQLKSIKEARQRAAQSEKNKSEHGSDSLQVKNAESLTDENTVLKTKHGKMTLKDMEKMYGKKNIYIVTKGENNYLVEPTQADLEQQAAAGTLSGRIALQAHAASSKSNIIVLDADTYESTAQDREFIRSFDGAPGEKDYHIMYQDGMYIPCIEENGAWKTVDIGLSSIAGSNNLARAMVFLKEYHDNDQSIDNAISAAKDTTKTKICARQAADQIANREISPFEVKNTQKESTLTDYALAEAPDGMSYQKGKAPSPVDQFIEKTISDLSDVDSLFHKQKVSDASLLSRAEQSQKEPLREQNISEKSNTAMEMLTGAFKKIIGVFSCAPLHAGSEMVGADEFFECNDVIENHGVEKGIPVDNALNIEESPQASSDGITLMPNQETIEYLVKEKNQQLNSETFGKSIMPIKQIDETLIQALQQAREAIDSKMKSSSDAKKNQTSKSILAIIDKTQGDLFGKVIENSDGKLAKKVMKGKIAFVSFLLNLSQKSEINQTSVGDAAIETGNGVLLSALITKLTGSAAGPVSWGLLLSDIADSLYYDGPAHNQFKKNAHLVRKELVNKLKNNKDTNGLKKLSSDVLTALSMQRLDNADFAVEASHKLAELHRWISTLLTSESNKQTKTAPSGKGKESEQGSRLQNQALNDQSKEHYDEENKQCVEEVLHPNLDEKSELPESKVFPDNGNQQSTTSKIAKKLTLSSKTVSGKNKVSRKSKANMLQSKAEMERIKNKFGFGQKEYDALSINESVYNSDPSKPTKIRGWKLVWTSDDALLTSKGYYGEAWVNTETGECMIAHRGSLSSLNQETYNNWAKSDKDIFFNKIPYDQENATSFSDSVRNELDLNVTFIETGHSKGGVNAGLNALRYGCEAILFDSPGFRESAQNLHQQSLREPDNMINYKLRDNAINSCNYLSCEDRSMIKEEKLGLAKNVNVITKYNPIFGGHLLKDFFERFHENPEIVQNIPKPKERNRFYTGRERWEDRAYQAKTNLFKPDDGQRNVGTSNEYQNN